MKVCVVGLGYIGFHRLRGGAQVISPGRRRNSDLIDKLNNGGLHIVNENGLAEITRRPSLPGASGSPGLRNLLTSSSWRSYALSAPAG